MFKSNIDRVSMSDEAIVKEICQNLKQLRLNKNVSQKILAEKSGLDPATISRVESGRAATLLTVVQILRALDSLDILDSFIQENEISPIEKLRMEKKLKKRASPFKPSVPRKKK